MSEREMKLRLKCFDMAVKNTSPESVDTVMQRYYELVEVMHLAGPE